MRLKSLLGAMICGILVASATGLLMNGSVIGIPEYRYYGYPLVWRVTSFVDYEFTLGTFILTNLAIDAAFWIAISLFALIILKKTVIHKL